MQGEQMYCREKRRKKNVLGSRTAECKHIEYGISIRMNQQ